jgi:hypothetical protein
MLLTAQTGSAHKQMLSSWRAITSSPTEAVFTTSVIGNVVETDRFALAIRGGKETFVDFEDQVGLS